jgi:hypothetical protein
MLVAAESRVAVCCLEKWLTVGREGRCAFGCVPLGCAAETGRRADGELSASWLVQLRASSVSGIATTALCTGLLCLVDRLIHSNTQQVDCDISAAVVNYFMATKTVNLYIYW